MSAIRCVYVNMTWFMSDAPLSFLIPVLLCNRLMLDALMDVGVKIVKIFMARKEVTIIYL